MSHRDSLTFQPTARDGGRILLGRTRVAEIRRLELVYFLPVEGGGSLIGADVGMPFYWRQYGNHQDPERRADARRKLECVEEGKNWMKLRATGATRSGSARSDYMVMFRVDGRGRLCCEVMAQLEVTAGPGWQVTPHPHHGELVFCTFWPEGVFSPTGRIAKRYDSCLVQRGQRNRRIMHHHLESPDKQHIRLDPGDRFAWGLEAQNPQLTIGPGTRVEAGICAYMWDTHFALRICRDGRNVVLPPGTKLKAAYTLETKTRCELQPAFKSARIASAGAVAGTPVYTGGLHGFRETFRTSGLVSNTAWPWQQEIVAGRAAMVEFARDSRTGCDDRYSLRLRHAGKAESRWLATTLGPAFGEPAFKRGGRLRLRAMVRTDELRGEVRIALRVHRAGKGSVFDIASFEIFPSEGVSGSTDWTELTMETPPLRPAPDRVHLLLELSGRGTAWFDNVALERLS